MPDPRDVEHAYAMARSATYTAYGRVLAGLADRAVYADAVEAESQARADLERSTKGE